MVQLLLKKIVLNSDSISKNEIDYDNKYSNAEFHKDSCPKTLCHLRYEKKQFNMFKL